VLAAALPLASFAAASTLVELRARRARVQHLARILGNGLVRTHRKAPQQLTRRELARRASRHRRRSAANGLPSD
jgi:hypothetical protein